VPGRLKRQPRERSIIAGLGSIILWSRARCRLQNGRKLIGLGNIMLPPTKVMNRFRWWLSIPGMNSLSNPNLPLSSKGSRQRYHRPCSRDVVVPAKRRDTPQRAFAIDSRLRPARAASEQIASYWSSLAAVRFFRAHIVGLLCRRIPANASSLSYRGRRQSRTRIFGPTSRHQGAYRPSWIEQTDRKNQ